MALPPLLSLPHLLLSTLLFYSSFSRFTLGVYTPTYYAYQSARHSGDNTPIASGDALLSTLLLFKATRVWAAGLLTVFLAVPVVEGWKSRGVAADGLLFCLGVGVLGVEILRRRE